MLKRIVDFFSRRKAQPQLRMTRKAADERLCKSIDGLARAVEAKRDARR